MFARLFCFVKHLKNAMGASPEQTFGCNVSRNKTNESCTHNGKGMIASKKLRARTVLASMPRGVCRWRRPS